MAHPAGMPDPVQSSDSALQSQLLLGSGKGGDSVGDGDRHRFN